jgi:hypothetical protein
LQLEHFVITRFNYRSKDARNQLDGPTRKIGEDPLDPERLELRFKLFESACLPSIMAQTDAAFSWILIVDRDLQARFRSRLESLLAGRNNSFLHIFDPEDNLDRLDWLGPYLRNSPDYMLTTNLDDDDALPKNFISALHAHVASAFDTGKLAPIKTLGVKEIVQWDMTTSRHAPLGWRSPWHRAQRTSSCGYSLLVKYPTFPFCVLGTKHKFAEHYFDFATASKDRHVELRRSAFIAAGKENNVQIDSFPTTSTFHDLSPETGPVVMSNHTNNVQKWRLYERKSDRIPVTGPETFPNVTLDLERFETYSQDFRNSLKDSLKSAVGRYLRFRKRRGTAN